MPIKFTPFGRLLKSYALSHRLIGGVRFHMKNLVPIVLLFLISGVSRAESDKLFGVWEAGSNNALAIYPVLMITKDHISWPNSSNHQRCTVRYRVTSTTVSGTYPDQWLPPEVAAKHEPDYYKIIRAELIPNKCASLPMALQFAFPKDIPDYVEVNTYETTPGRPDDTTLHYTGGMHFHRGH